MPDQAASAMDAIFEVDLPLSRLLLDEENFRIDEVDQQLDALLALLRQQKDGKKIFNLARHIVEHGRLAPGERLLVIPNDRVPLEDDDYYIVMEGNRRVAALKLLEDPSLIELHYPALYRRFLELSPRAPKHLFQAVPCVVLPDRDTALEWVETKHSTDLDGVGVEKWDARATARFAERRGRFRRWRIALARLEKAGINTAKIRQGIERKTSAVERVLGSGAMKSVLGVIFHNKDGKVEFENGDEQAGLNLLYRLLLAMADDSFNTGTVHALHNREQFIMEFAEFAVKKLESNVSAGRPRTTEPATGVDPTLSSDSTPSDGLGAADSEHRRARKPVRRVLRKREWLAPREGTQTFHVIDPALNELYREARQLSIKQFPRIGAVVTRVFLELSCDLYLEHRALPLPNQARFKNWPDAPLAEKVRAVLRDLDPKKSNSSLDMVRKGLGSQDWLHSIHSLHKFVHDRFATISEDEARQIWDRYQPFFRLLHERLSDGV